MSVAVLRFRAGPNTFALAAGCVEAVGEARPDIPHLTWVLGQQLPEFTSGSRALHLVDHDQRVDVLVDGPVELVQLEAGDIVPCRTTTSTSIMGFAHGDHGVFALLDATSLVALVRESARTNFVESSG